MKRSCSLTALVAAFALTTSGVAVAGPTPSSYVEINGVIAAATQLTVTQSVVGGKNLFTVTARADVGTSLKFLSMLADVMASSANVQGNGTMKVSFVGGDGVVTDARSYGEISIRRISMPNHDANSKVPLGQSEIEITARSQTTLATGHILKPVLNKLLLSESHFSMSITDLPSANIKRVSSRSFVPCAAGGCDSMTSFDVMIMGNDRLAWSTWQQQAATNPALKKTGSLSLTNAAGTVAKIAMVDVVPLSYEETVSAEGSFGKVRLKVGRAFFKQ